MKQEIINALRASLKKLNIESDIQLTPSKNHGDFSTNIAMKLASQLKDNPVNIASKIVDGLESKHIANATVDGPGFINIFLNKSSVNSIVEDIIDKGENFGKLEQGKYINIEYVSANPTGQLHLGHAKIAAVGSTLVNILKFAGNKVDSEFYVNDAGNQIKLLGISVYTRYQQLFGSEIELPEEAYRGQDIIEVAEELKKQFGNKYENKPYEEVKDFFMSESKKILFEIMKVHLADYKVKFDTFFSEQSVYDNNQIVEALDALKSHTYEAEDATWLKTTELGDDKDRVLIKKDGTYTYFLPDIAYHKIKLDRGYDELVNIWGADHIGYIKRMEVALEYLGLPKDKLDILIVQLVKLFRDGQEVKMSKRKGTTYSLEDLIKEVGVDAARWFMIDAALNSVVVFDLTKALEKSNENPVFSVQYSHARAHQLIEKLGENSEDETYDQKETELIQELAKFPEIIEVISKTHKVNALPQYLLGISRSFNSWYTNTKALNSPKEAILKKLSLATQVVLANGLKLMGINAPNKM